MAPGSAVGACCSPAATLRARTRAAHAHVETRVDAGARLRDRAAYRAWLELLLGFHTAADPMLEERFGELPPSGRRARLARDLTALGASATEVAAVPAMDAAALPGPAGAAGVLYVVEGSALGGAVLGRRARAALGVTALSGGAFFTGGGSPAPRWRAVGAVLQERLGDAAALDDAVAGALGAFSAFEAWACR